MCWTRQMSQKYVLPHLSNAIFPLTSMHCTKTISRSRMASFILVPRASISVGHVVGETGIFFNDILRRVALGTRIGDLSKALIKAAAPFLFANKCTSLHYQARPLEQWLSSLTYCESTLYIFRI